MKRYLKFIIPIIIVLLIGGGMFLYYKKTQPKSNEATATGNTGSNLHNGGLFCEYNGKIYFANPYDNNYLYVMDSDCTNARQLNTDSVAYINVSNDYIFYVKNNYNDESIGTVFRGWLYGVCRTDLEGQNTLTLYHDLSGTLSICGNYVYYQHYDNDTALTLHKITINGEEDKLIAATDYSPASVEDGKIYFTDTDKKNAISYIDPKTDSITKIYDANSYLVTSDGNYIYYIDVAKKYSLVRLNKTTKTVELLYQADNSKVINFNIYQNKIFFQLEGKNNPGLYRMNADGTQIEYIATGNLTNIHCTSKYTFFQYYENQGVLYRVPTTGPANSVEEIRISK